MKRIFFLTVFCCLSFSAFAQTPNGPAAKPAPTKSETADNTTYLPIRTDKQARAGAAGDQSLKAYGKGDEITSDPPKLTPAEQEAGKLLSKDITTAQQLLQAAQKIIDKGIGDADVELYMYRSREQQLNILKGLDVQKEKWFASVWQRSGCDQCAVDLKTGALTKPAPAEAPKK